MVSKSPSKPIDEATNESLSRIRAYLQGRNIGIITAYRASHTDEARKEYASELVGKPEHQHTDWINGRRNSSLMAHIRNHGFGFVHIRGTYVLNIGDPNEKRFEQHSYLMIGIKRDDHGAMKGFLRKFGAQFDQESALYKPHDEKSAHLIGTSDHSDFLKKGETKDLGEFDPNLVAAYHAILVSGESASIYEDGNTSVFEDFQFWESTSWFNRKERLWVPTDKDLE